MSEGIELLIKVLGWIVPAGAAFFFGQLSIKLKKATDKAERLEIERLADEEKRAEELKAIKSACKYTLRKTLKEDWEFYTKQGWCSVEEKAEIDGLYELYHNSFNGNGTGTRYYNEINALPTHPDDVEKDD